MKESESHDTASTNESPISLIGAIAALQPYSINDQSLSRELVFVENK